MYSASRPPRSGLGFPLAFATTVASSAPSIFDSLSDIFGGEPRAGGADPCCPPGYDPPGKWPRNSGLEGAPPDYRTPGAPMADPSPSGVGRLKDDVCDCVPISYRGRLYVIGELERGVAYPGRVSERGRDGAVWIEVTRDGRAVRVPGFPPLEGAAPAPAPSSGSFGGAAPEPAGVWTPPLPLGYTPPGAHLPEPSPSSGADTLQELARDPRAWLWAAAAGLGFVWMVRDGRKRRY